MTADSRSHNAYEAMLDALDAMGCSPDGTDRMSIALCPAHNDHNPSLVLTRIEGSLLMHCRAGCTIDEVLGALGRSKTDLFDSRQGATYVYEDGRKVHRRPDKKFSQNGARKGEPSQLFRLSSVIDAVAFGLPVYLVEGEKDVLALEAIGVIATTAPMGAANWKKVDVGPLTDAIVVAVPDSDEAGQNWARDVATSLRGTAESLTFVKAAVGKDVADHVAAGLKICDLLPWVGPEVREPIDVTNSASAADWLLNEVGRPGSKLAGMFRRGDQIVHTPRIGEDGYIPLEEGVDVDDGPAQVRVVDAGRLHATVTFEYEVRRGDSSREHERAIFPKQIAMLVGDVADMAPNLRPLRGVTHTPLLRRDGTVLDTEGYDEQTRRLYLPPPGMGVVPVPQLPSRVEVNDAVDLIMSMIQDFPFNTVHDRANYVALLLTPLLRELIPPPYKMGLINAHQRGSGKSLLAWILRTLHGGVLRGDVPESGAEFRKQITSVLITTTAPVVQFDNVRKIAATQLDALLTSDEWTDRVLGASKDVTARNDRLWVATGNNILLGGDLMRRVLWTSIDPKSPRPEERTDFAIPNLKGWVSARRGQLLSALLTLIRAWVASGSPIEEAVGEDDYSRWIEACRAILLEAGVEGVVGHRETVRQVESEDDEQWGTFLAALYGKFGTQWWTAKQAAAALLDDAAPDGLDVGNARMIGVWCRNREGRFAGDFCVRGKAGRNGVRWWIEKHEQDT